MAFDYSNEKVKRLIVTLSQIRISKYFERAGDNERDGFDLYVLNTRLCESFYTPLQGMEIAVRNALNDQLTQAYGTNWYDDSALLLQQPQRAAVKRAMSAIRERKKEITVDRMVAELSFGFWTGILGPKYETELWRRCTRHAFPFRPRGTERREVHSAINRIRRLRNRVAHHEPILLRNLPRDHEIILEIIGWICPDTAQWVEAQSRFPGVWHLFSGKI